MAILTIAALTLREASRRRLLLAVALLTLVVVVLTGWGFQHLLSVLRCGGPGCAPAQTAAIAATLLILVMFMLSFVFSVAAVFVAPSIASDVESGIVLAMLPRPIRRGDLVLGKWLGLTLLVGGYTAATAGLELLVVWRLAGYLPPHPVAAVLYLVGESLALLLLALLASTRLAPMTGGIVLLLLFGAAWMGGIAERIGLVVGNGPITNIGVASSLILPTDGLWRGALYSLEPAVLVVASGAERAASTNPFLVNAPPSAAYVAWSLAWMAAILGLTILSFSRREL